MPAWPHDPRDLREHRREPVLRQVLDDVQRVALGERAVGKRQPSQIAEHEIRALERLAGEVRRDVDAHHRRAALEIPDERPAAAAPQIDDHIARRWAEEAPQHPLADAGLQQRRRHGLVARIGMQGRVEILRLLGERRRGPQVQIARAFGGSMSARLAHERLAGVCQGPAAVGTARQRQQRRGDHRRAPVASSTGLEPFGARVPAVAGRRVERGARQPVEPRAIGQQRVDGSRQRSRLPRLDEHRVHVVGQHFTQRRQIRRDHRAARGEVLEELQRRRVALGNRAPHVRQREDLATADGRGDVGWRQPSGELDAVRHATRASQRLEPRPVALSGLPADDEPVDAGDERKRLDQDVHAFPRIQVTRVSHLRRAVGRAA